MTIVYTCQISSNVKRVSTYVFLPICDENCFKFTNISWNQASIDNLKMTKKLSTWKKKNIIMGKALLLLQISIFFYKQYITIKI